MIKINLKNCISVIVLVTSSHAFGGQWVDGYFRSDGTYVEGYYRSNPDEYRFNNYKSKSNGGSQKDELNPNGGATNKSNPNYYLYDNDGDGTINYFDPTPNKRGIYD